MSFSTWLGIETWEFQSPDEYTSLYNETISIWGIHSFSFVFFEFPAARRGREREGKSRTCGTGHTLRVALLPGSVCTRTHVTRGVQGRRKWVGARSLARSLVTRRPRREYPLARSTTPTTHGGNVMYATLGSRLGMAWRGT